MDSKHKHINLNEATKKPTPTEPTVKPTVLTESTLENHGNILDNQYGRGLAHDIGGYMGEKRRKLHEQFQNLPISLASHYHTTTLDHSSSEEPKKRGVDQQQQATNLSIFENVVVWVNGYTQPPLTELRTLVCSHGGSIELTYLSTVTHIVATNLPPSKIIEYKKVRKFLRVIYPSWIVDCVAAGKKLSETPYILPSMRDSSISSHG